MRPGSAGRPLIGIPTTSDDILYFSNVADGNFNVFIVEPSTIANQQVTFGTDTNTRPAWFPDRRKIVYRRSSPTVGMVTIDLNTRVITEIVTGIATVTDFSVSPDGLTIAFTGTPTSETAALFTIPAAGGTPTRMTPNGQTASCPRWARDGSVIFFLYTVAGGRNIYSILPNGTGLTAKTAGITILFWYTVTSDNLQAYFVKSLGAGIVRRTFATSVDVAVGAAGYDAPSLSSAEDRLVFNDGNAPFAIASIRTSDGLGYTTLAEGNGSARWGGP